MAAMIIMMQMQEEDNYRKDKLILEYHNKEKLIRENMILHGGNFGINYGIMYYTTYRVRGVNITEYRVLCTTKSLDELSTFLSTIILTSLSKHDINYLVYTVNNIDANLVSYDVVKSSTFPWFHVKVHRIYSKKLVTFTGNRDFRSKIHLPFVINYNNYAVYLQGQKKKQLKKLDHDRYPFLFYTKNNLIKLLLIREKKAIKQN